MLKWNIKYEDFNGKKYDEDFYFNLTAADMAMMDAEYEGGYTGYLATVTETENGGKMMLILRAIISKAYGVRSEDGKSFRKSEVLTEEFLSGNAFNEMFMGFLLNPETIPTFMLGILPEALRAEAAKAMADDGVDTRPIWVREDRDPTTKELRGLSKDEMMIETKRMIDKKNATSPDEQ